MNDSINTVVQNMPKQDFLFELGCEELPPNALTKLAMSLHDHLAASFRASKLSFEISEWFATPRRLAVHFVKLDGVQADKQVQYRRLLTTTEMLSLRRSVLLNLTV